MTNAATKVNTSNTAAGEYLLERLRILLNRLQAASDILQKWPEAKTDSAKIHADTATELIASIRKIVLSIRTIERHVNGTGPKDSETTTPHGIIPRASLDSFRLSLDSKCPIPLDLLDLMDVGHPFGTNPQVYARGLMKEALRQLEGLERRKRGLAMLAEGIERGLENIRNESAGLATGGKEESGKGGSDGVGTIKVKVEEDAKKVKVEEGMADEAIQQTNNKRKREGNNEESEYVVKKERTDTDS